MIEMFLYLTKKLDPEECGRWKILAVMGLISPVVDIFSFSVIIYIINKTVRDNAASPGLILFTLCMTGVSAGKCLFELYRSKVTNSFVYEGGQKLSMKMYELLIKEDLTAHNQKDSMQALAMVREDTTNCIRIITSCIGIWVNGITLAGYACLLIYAIKWIGVVSNLALAVFMAGVFRRNRERMKVYGERSRALAIRTNAQITIAYGSFKEMKIDDRSDFVLRKYRDVSVQHAQTQSRYQYKSSSIGLVLRNSVMGAMFVILAMILVAGSDLAVILAPMVVYVAAISRMIPLANMVLGGLNSIEFAKKPYCMLKAAMCQYEEMKAEEEKTEKMRKKLLTFQKGVSVKNLTFGYREGVKLFEDASIEIPAGCSVAIIGVSGAGKTTFLDLILGLLKPEKGQVYYDDYDIVTHTDGEGECRAGIGQIVSYIPQTVYLNGETVRNNVAFFEEESDIDDARVEECLKCAKIWEDVAKLPEGIHTLIGANGTSISGGQRQRLALARALYKDFDLLVMDEATAALDMETEKAVIDSIRQVRKNRTLLIVTHHMSLARECDLIYKIQDRKILRVK